MAAFGSENSSGLNLKARSQSVDPRVSQRTIFPLEAFEFDDPNKVDNPKLTMKSPWELISGGLDVYEDGVDKDNLLDGDRRLTIEGEVLMLQHWDVATLAWVNDISLGGYDGDGDFLDFINARGMTRTIADASKYAGGYGIQVESGDQSAINYFNLRPSTEIIKPGEDDSLRANYENSAFTYNGKQAYTPSTFTIMNSKNANPIVNRTSTTYDQYYTAFNHTVGAFRFRATDTSGLAINTQIAKVNLTSDLFWATGSLKTAHVQGVSIYLTPSNRIEFVPTTAMTSPSLVIISGTSVLTNAISNTEWNTVLVEVESQTVVSKDTLVPTQFVHTTYLRVNLRLNGVSYQGTVTAATTNGLQLIGGSIGQVKEYGGLAFYDMALQPFDFGIVDLMLTTSVRNYSYYPAFFNTTSTLPDWCSAWEDDPVGYWDLFDAENDLHLVPGNGKVIITNPYGEYNPIVTSGPKGNPGDTGATGLTGETGATGADSIVPGPIGLTGPQGDTGDQGIQGIQGVQGDQGLPGVDGVTIIWKGELASAPSSPLQYWAYYNTTDGNSYIYDGTEWDILAQAGQDGVDGIGVPGEIISLTAAQMNDTPDTVSTWTANRIYIAETSDAATDFGITGSVYGVVTCHFKSSNRAIQIYYDKHGATSYQRGANGTVWGSWVEQWSSGNDGAGSGLDADTVDGTHISSIQTPKLTADTLCITVSGDWDDHITTGFYMGSSLANESPGISWRYCLVMTHNPVWTVQTMWDFSGTTTYVRNKTDGVWNAWTKLIRGSEPGMPKYISGGGATGAWTGTHEDITSYYDGLVVIFKSAYNGISPQTTLNINGLGVKKCYYTDTGALTTHIGDHRPMTLVYQTNLDGGAGGFILSASYYSNESYTVRWNNYVRNGDDINYGYKITLQKPDGRFDCVTVGSSTAWNGNVVSSREFRMDGQVLYYHSGTNVSANVEHTTVYQSILTNELEFWTNKGTAVWATDNRPVYLVGVPSTDKSTFTLLGAGTYDNKFVTQTLPTDYNGYIYIQLGFMNDSADAMRLSTEHPVYWHNGSAVVPYQADNSFRYTNILTNNAYRQVLVETSDGELMGAGGTTHVSDALLGMGPIGSPPTFIAPPTGETGNLIQQSAHATNLWRLYDNGNLWGTGVNSAGQLGKGNTTTPTEPVIIANGATKYWGTQTHDYAYGYDRLIFEDNFGSYWGTGRNGNGELALGYAGDRNVPTGITFIPSFGLKNVWHVGGYDGYCFWELTDGRIMFSGDNAHGQSGDGTTATTVSTAKDVTSYWGGSTLGSAGAIVDMKMTHNYNATAVGTAVMLRADGSVRGAGYDAWSQLGQNSTNSKTTAVVILGSGVVQIANPCGSVMTLFMLTSAGHVYRCGHNAQGQLGQGNNTTTSMFPYNSGDSNNIDQNCDLIFNADRGAEASAYNCSGVFLRDRHDGTTWACGDNGNGVLGVGDAVDRNVFTRIRSNEKFLQIKCHGSGDTAGVTTGLDSKGRLWQWGYGGVYSLHTHGNLGPNSSFGFPLLMDAPNQ